MPKYDIDSATVGDYGTPDLSIDNADTDGVIGLKETEWINPDWKEQWGAFTEVSEYQNALLMKAIWNTGKGWTADARTTAILDNINGWGKDTFDDIIFNQDVISMAAGDSYAHIIRNDNGDFINLKPLNPGSMKHIVGEYGLIKRYEQLSRIKPNKVVKEFRLQEIFHLSFNRLADQIHGISLYNKLKPIILADEKSFVDMQKIMSFQAKPFVIFKLKTDDTTKINTFITKVKDLRTKGDDLFIPDDENLLSWEIVQISPSQLLMDWRDDLRNKFYRAVGLPQIVPGGGEKGTGSESRTIYLAFEQLVAQRQLYLEKQIWQQLALKVKFNPPTTMSDLIGSTEQKTQTGAEAQPSELNPAAAKQ